jgi:diguanylate cyclase (GGDEF)-like protein/PAS domain S-box-containing protein
MRTNSICIFIVMLLVCLTGTIFPSVSVQAAEPVKIGILSFRPKPQTLKQWQPLADALKQAMPEHDFVIEALTCPEMNEAVAKRKVDFVLTNPCHFILLKEHYGLTSPLATLAVDIKGQRFSAFGGVILTRAERNDINTLGDIKGKRIAVPDTESLGGYQMQAYELKKVGIYLPKNATLVVTGMPHDNVIKAVLDGRADVGFVRTGVVEGAAHDGMLDIRQIKVLNLQKQAKFPQQLSTPLYPEWPFSAMPQTNEKIARLVAAKLFEMEADNPFMQAMRIHGFSVPADYHSVAVVLRELRFPPFDAAPGFTLQDVLERYRWQVAGGLAVMAVILLLSARLFITKRRLQITAHELTVSKAYLQAILDNEPECISIIAADGTFKHMNPAGLAMIKADASEQIVNRSVYDFVAPEYRSAYEDMHSRVIAGEKVKLEFEVVSLNGQRRIFETHAAPIYDNAAVEHLSVMRDITDRKHAEAALRESEQQFRELSHSSPTAIMLHQNNRWVYANEAAERISGFSFQELLSQNTWDFIHPDYKQLIMESGQKRQRGEAVKPGYEAKIISKGGSEKWIEVYGASTTIGGHSAGIISIIDITQRKQSEEQIWHMATHDSLTGLPTRHMAKEHLTMSLGVARRNKTMVALMFMDLDGFKSVNDTLGHDAGDYVLKQVAQRMLSCVRKTDIVARVGGDEFLIIATGLENTDNISKIAEKLITAVSQPISYNEQQAEVGTSIGIAIFPLDCTDEEKLIMLADEAMYEVKKTGKNGYRFAQTANRLSAGLTGH